MKKIEFKPLTPEQIEVRPAEAKKGRVTLLLYIDSRAAANILNTTVGEFNWQIEYKDVSGEIYGRLSIWDDDRKMWVYKEDTGSESNVEAQKGRASDILKRCLARWGCDFLYTAPRIVLDAPEKWFFNDRLTMTFSVKSITYEGKRISSLTIVDRFGNEVFNWKDGQTAKTAPVPQTDEQRRLSQLKLWYDTKKKDPTVDIPTLVEFKNKYKAEAKDFKYKDFNCDLLWSRYVKTA